MSTYFDKMVPIIEKSFKHIESGVLSVNGTTLYYLTGYIFNKERQSLICSISHQGVLTQYVLDCIGKTFTVKRDLTKMNSDECESKETYTLDQIGTLKPGGIMGSIFYDSPYSEFGFLNTGKTFIVPKGFSYIYENIKDEQNDKDFDLEKAVILIYRDLYIFHEDRIDEYNRVGKMLK